MSLLKGWLQKARETFAREREQEALDAEIRFHLEREIERLERDGLDRAEARKVAARAFGTVERVKEQAREESGFQWLEQMLRDLRHAGRGLKNNPVFTTAAVLTLGLGIGATTAIFSVLSAVVLRPLPYVEPGRVVRVSHTDSEGDRLGMPDGGYLYYSENATTLSDLAIYIERSVPLTGTGEALELGIIQATSSLFRVLGVSPVLGRAFTEEDARPGAPDVAVLTHAFWQSRFEENPDVIGTPVVPGSDVEIIGVLPAGFDFIRPDATVTFGNAFDEPQILVPLTVRPTRARFGNFMYQGIGRLAPGATAEASARELRVLMMQAPEAYPGGHTVRSLREGGHRPLVAPLKEAMVGRTAEILWILFGAVGFVLLIATANVANLFVVRAESRRREIAVRRALGAGSRALARSFLSESVLISILGGLLGVGLAQAGTHALLRLAPPEVPRLDQVSLDGRVLGFAAAVTILTGLLFGILPLFRYLTDDIRAATAGENRGATSGPQRHRARQMLVVSQVAFAGILLVGSGLLVRTFRNVREIDPGFDSDNVLTLRLSLPGSEFRDDVARSRVLLDLTEQLERMPGVEIAAFAGDLPLDGDEWRDYVAVEGAIPDEGSGGTSALRVFIGPGYLKAIGARLTRGRELERRDFAAYPEYVVVNEAFAKQRWPGEDPIGKRLAQWAEGQEGDIWYTVSGVVSDIRESSLMVEPEPTVYLPTVFRPDDGFAMFVSNMPLVLRTARHPHDVFPEVEREIRAFHPEIPINTVMSLAELEARSFREVSFATTLLVIASAVALLLGIVGIHGIVTYVVSQRTREFGVRIALGATPRHVRAVVLRQGGGVALLGILIGLGGALLLSRILRSLLFGVSATDLPVYVSVAVGLFLVVLAAALVPARRATAVDPVEAIRAE